MRTNLPFVETDVTELRNFLLTDTVLEARNAIVTRPLVENYMLNRFTSNSSLLTREDVPRIPHGSGANSGREEVQLGSAWLSEL